MNVISQNKGAGLTRAPVRTGPWVGLCRPARGDPALARQCVLDYVACTLAGAAEPLTTMLLAEMAEQGGRDAPA